MEKVADLSMRGINPTEIAKTMGLQRKMVIELFNEYKDTLSRDSQARDMARDHLHIMVKHYDGLMKKYYDLLSKIQAEQFSHQIAGQENAALKAIADLEAKRLDALQKAGLLDANDLGDELAEMEEKQAVLIDILRNDLCPNCKHDVVRKLQKVSNVVEAVVVFNE